MEYYVGPEGELPPGSRLLVKIEQFQVCIFNVDGRHYALSNKCAHQGAPLCSGQVTGTTLPSRAGEILWGRDGEVLRCPWHGWEYDITTGRTLFDPTVSVRTLDVTVRDGHVYVKIGNRT